MQRQKTSRIVTLTNSYEKKRRARDLAHDDIRTGPVGTDRHPMHQHRPISRWEQFIATDVKCREQEPLAQLIYRNDVYVRDIGSTGLLSLATLAVTRTPIYP